MPTKKTAGEEPKPKRAPRTQKEKAFAKEYIANGGNATQAALKVYDTDSVGSAKKIGHENTTKLSLVEMMDRVVGLRPQDRLMKLVEGLNATKAVSGIGDANSRTVEFVDVEDHAARFKYLELTYKLDGSLRNSLEVTGKDGGPVQVQKVEFEMGESGS